MMRAVRGNGQGRIDDVDGTFDPRSSLVNTPKLHSAVDASTAEWSFWGCGGFGKGFVTSVDGQSGGRTG